jgi:hypothetical protein
MERNAVLEQVVAAGQAHTLTRIAAALYEIKDDKLFINGVDVSDHLVIEVGEFDEYLNKHPVKVGYKTLFGSQRLYENVNFGDIANSLVVVAGDINKKREHEEWLAAVRSDILVALKAADAINPRWENKRLYIDGIDMSWQCDITADAIIVGRSDRRTGERRSRFPARNGAFRYAKIAATLIAKARQTKAAMLRDQKQLENRSVAELLRKELNLESFSPINIYETMDAEKPVRVQFSINRSLTVAEAKELVNKLRASGII